MNTVTVLVYTYASFCIRQWSVRRSCLILLLIFFSLTPLAGAKPQTDTVYFEGRTISLKSECRATDTCTGEFRGENEENFIWTSYPDGTYHMIKYSQLQGNLYNIRIFSGDIQYDTLRRHIGEIILNFSPLTEAPKAIELYGIPKKQLIVLWDSAASLEFTAELGTHEKSGVVYQDGKYKSYYKETDKLLEVGSFKRNARIGKWISYHMNGKIQSKGRYSGQFGQDSTLLYQWYDDRDSMLKVGADTAGMGLSPQMVRGLVRPYNLKTGTWKYYNESGNLIRKEVYRKGKLIRATGKLED